MFIDGETVAMIGTKLTVDADKVIDATGKLLVPGGIDAHTHLDMPFGGTTSVDDFETGTRAAAFGGTTTIVDFAIQDFGGSIREAADTWAAKARDKACIDYGFHMILREFNSDLSREMKDMVNEGVTSFKLFMAYPGVFLMDDAGIFKAMQRSGEIGATICMHAENGIVIDVLVEQALRRGETEPKYHALTRPPAGRGRGRAPRHRPGRDGARAGLHRAPLRRRGARAGDRRARPRARGLRRDLPAVPVPLHRRLRRA